MPSKDYNHATLYSQEQYTREPKFPHPIQLSDLCQSDGLKRCLWVVSFAFSQDDKDEHIFMFTMHVCFKREMGPHKWRNGFGGSGSNLGIVGSGIGSYGESYSLSWREPRALGKAPSSGTPTTRPKDFLNRWFSNLAWSFLHRGWEMGWAGPESEFPIPGLSVSSSLLICLTY